MLHNTEITTLNGALSTWSWKRLSFTSEQVDLRDRSMVTMDH